MPFVINCKHYFFGEATHFLKLFVAKKNISTYGRVCCRGYLLDRHLLPHHPTHASHLSPPPSSHALPAHTHLLPAVTARHHHSHAQPHYMLRTACPIASFFRWWPARPRPPRVVLSIRSLGQGGHDPLPPYPEAAGPSRCCYRSTIAIRAKLQTCTVVL